MDAAETSPFWVCRFSPADAERAWPAAAPRIEAALRRSDGLFTADDYRDLVTREGSHVALWGLGDKTDDGRVRLLAAWVTAIVKFPRTNALDILVAGGRGMNRWYATALAETEKFAREAGCDRLRCVGRNGWSRRGYTATGILYERNL